MWKYASRGRERWRVGSACGVRMGSVACSWRERTGVSDEKKGAGKKAVSVEVEQVIHGGWVAGHPGQR